MHRAILVFFLVAVAAPRSFAQNTISGRVLDPEGKPVPNMEVLLHGITGSSGSQIDRDTSGADGSFAVTVENADPKAVYFVAVIYQGQLYIGDLMRAPFPASQEYIVRVGVNPVNLSSPAEGTQLSPQEAEKDRSAGIAVIVVATLAVGSVVLLAFRRRPPAQRRWLVELARVEEELADAPAPDAALQKRRTELRNRLKAPKSG